MSICPSASEGTDIPELLNQIIEKEVFRSDYMEITSYFQNEPLDYDTAISTLTTIISSGIFIEI